jgi:hypothetical protein
MWMEERGGQINEERVRQAAATGARRSPSPARSARSCSTTGFDVREGTRVVDVSTLLAESLQEDEDERGIGPLLDLARQYTEAWCSGIPRAWPRTTHPRASLTINGGTPFVGREQIADAARSFMTAFRPAGADGQPVPRARRSSTADPRRHQLRPRRHRQPRSDLRVRGGRSAPTASSPNRRATTTRPSTSASSRAVRRRYYRAAVPGGHHGARCAGPGA